MVWMPTENDPAYKYIESCIGTALDRASRATVLNAVTGATSPQAVAGFFLKTYGVNLTLEVARKIYNDLSR